MTRVYVNRPTTTCTGVCVSGTGEPEPFGVIRGHKKVQYTVRVTGAVLLVTFKVIGGHDVVTRPRPTTTGTVVVSVVRPDVGRSLSLVSSGAQSSRIEGPRGALR